MNWIDRPIEPPKARLRGIGKKRRKLTARWDTASALQSWSILPKTVVLVDWHRDEHGCRARAVGCVEGNAPAG